MHAAGLFDQQCADVHFVIGLRQVANWLVEYLITERLLYVNVSSVNAP